MGAPVPKSFKKCAKTANFRSRTKILIFYDRKLIFISLDSSHQDDQFDTIKLHFILKNNKDTGAFHVKCTQKRGLFDTPDSELNDFWYTGSPID